MQTSFVQTIKNNNSQLSQNSLANRINPLLSASQAKQKQKPVWMIKAKMMFQFIQERSNPETSRHEISYEQKYRSCGKELNLQKQKNMSNFKQMSGSTSHTTRNAITSRSPKTQRNETPRKNKVFQQLFERREKFLKQFGYVKNKNIHEEQEKRQQIAITPCIQNANQRLFLSEVEMMKLERSLQQYQKMPQSIRRSRKQRQNLNRSINQAEDRLKVSNQGKQHQQCFIKTKKILSTMDFKPAVRQINIQRITQSLSRCSNRIYGKSHQAQSVIWCTQVLAAQLQDQLSEKIKQKKSKSRGLNKTKKLLEKLNNVQFKTIDDF